jgi:predicted amidohydrolase
VIELAAVHFTPAFGDVAGNRDAVLSLCRIAAERARLVVLPELCTTGFSLSREQAEDWAEPLGGPSVAALRQVSMDTGAIVVAGLALRDEGGILRNAQVLVDGSSTHMYAKHHLYGDDFSWAKAGDAPGAVVETSLGAVGLLICHDIVYPSTVVSVAQRRPRLLAFSTAWIGDPESIGLPEEWRIVAQFLEPAPLVVANRGGAEGAAVFGDPSAVLTLEGATVGTCSADSQILFGRLPCGPES